MRRALVFLGISSLLFGLALVLVGVPPADNRAVLNAGMVSVVLGLIYTVWPVPATKALALIPCVPLGTLLAVLS